MQKGRYRKDNIYYSIVHTLAFPQCDKINNNTAACVQVINENNVDRNNPQNKLKQKFNWCE